MKRSIEGTKKPMPVTFSKSDLEQRADTICNVDKTLFDIKPSELIALSSDIAKTVVLKTLFWKLE